MFCSDFHRKGFAEREYAEPNHDLSPQRKSSGKRLCTDRIVVFSGPFAPRIAPTCGLLEAFSRSIPQCRTRWRSEGDSNLRYGFEPKPRRVRNLQVANVMERRLAQEIGISPFEEFGSNSPSIRVDPRIGVDSFKPPTDFWGKLNRLPVVTRPLGSDVKRALEKTLPDPKMEYTLVRRQAGLGSLGQQRFVAIANWQGGCIAREAKACCPLLAHGSRASWDMGSRITNKQSLRRYDRMTPIRRS